MNHIVEHFLFYSQNIADDVIIFDAEEARHAFLVLRLQRGDTIFVTDGRGNIFKGDVEQVDVKACRIRIISRECFPAPQPAMYLYIGLPDRGPFETVLSGLVALGVISIVPVVCAYCQKKWWEKKWDDQAERFNKKIIAVAKQSWNSRPAVLQKPLSFSQAVAAVSGPVFVADEQGMSIDSVADGFENRPSVMHCFIGPPGGFSPEEQSAFDGHHALRIKLSGYRLRTELAAVVLTGNLVQKYCLA